MTTSFATRPPCDRGVPAARRRPPPSATERRRPHRAGAHRRMPMPPACRPPAARPPPAGRPPTGRPSAARRPALTLPRPAAGRRRPRPTAAERPSYDRCSAPRPPPPPVDRHLPGRPPPALGRGLPAATFTSRGAADGRSQRGFGQPGRCAAPGHRCPGHRCPGHAGPGRCCPARPRLQPCVRMVAQRRGCSAPLQRREGLGSRRPVASGPHAAPRRGPPRRWHG